MSKFRTPEHLQTTNDWLSLGFMYLVGWELDENMDEDDAMFVLEPLLDKAITSQYCPSYDCEYVSHDGAALLLYHLNVFHGWSIHLLTGWMYRHESCLELKEGTPETLPN
jgi:hypothetical protein